MWVSSSASWETTQNEHKMQMSRYQRERRAVATKSTMNIIRDLVWWTAVNNRARANIAAWGRRRGRIFMRGAWCSCALVSSEKWWLDSRAVFYSGRTDRGVCETDEDCALPMEKMALSPTWGQVEDRRSARALDTLDSFPNERDVLAWRRSRLVVGQKPLDTLNYRKYVPWTNNVIVWNPCIEKIPHSPRVNLGLVCLTLPT